MNKNFDLKKVQEFVYDQAEDYRMRAEEEIVDPIINKLDPNDFSSRSEYEEVVGSIYYAFHKGMSQAEFEEDDE